MKICIAYDGSDPAQDALNDLPRAGLPPVAEVRVLTMADVFLPPQASSDTTLPPPISASIRQAWEQAEQAVEAARGLAQQAQARIQALFPGWQVEAQAHADSPAWGIIKQVDVWQPDLVVVGSHGRSLLGRFMLGSVSQKVVAEARCTVRVARRTHKTRTAPARIVLGVDGSPDAMAAVQVVAARLWPEGSAVRLVTALDTRLATASAPSQPLTDAWLDSNDTDPQAWIGRMLEAYTGPLEAAGLAVSSVIKAGDPKTELPAEAEQWDADCVVVGARGLSRVARFLIGSVSLAVAARAPCSVEVVRPHSVG